MQVAEDITISKGEYAIYELNSHTSNLNTPELFLSLKVAKN